MKIRIAAFIIILSFLFSTAFIYAADQPALPAAGEAAAPKTAAPASEAAAQKSGTDEVIVYYFYTSARCPSCLKIEAYTKEAINTAFADKLKNGGMVWKMVNYEEAANEHFVEEYKLFTKSVVLADSKSGKWKNLDKVWELLGDKDTFEKYVTDETRAFVEGKK